MKFESGTGWITVEPEKITIEHKRGTPNGGKIKTIKTSAISAVEIRRAGRIMAGSLALIFSGSSDSKGHTRIDAAKDENTIMFRRKDENKFIECKELIEKYILSQ